MISSTFWNIMNVTNITWIFHYIVLWYRFCTFHSSHCYWWLIKSFSNLVVLISFYLLRPTSESDVMRMIVKIKCYSITRDAWNILYQYINVWQGSMVSKSRSWSSTYIKIKGYITFMLVVNHFEPFHPCANKLVWK